MSAYVVYDDVGATLNRYLPPAVDPSTRERLALLVTGMIRGKAAAPAQIAKALHTLGLSDAKAESIERRVRRIENDPELSASLCLHPMARCHLALGKAEHLFISLDPTTKEDKIVMLAANVWYRGRALPLAWTIWPGNTPLEGERFWERVEAVLTVIAPLLPHGAQIIFLADRAFGSPAFTDRVQNHGWHYVVRVQGQTHYRTRPSPAKCAQNTLRRAQGRTSIHWSKIGCDGPLFCVEEGSIRSLVSRRGKRKHKQAAVFKKAGWRKVAVVVHWAKRYKGPMCIVSDLNPCYELLEWYKLE